ncbi:hypothetical protein UUU_18300 [Klebsiella pneumoniae subsp. pneumoniae DSM 30104 = JCM 1662 = NBRC 14940]|nr:hypothetical protein UUU_18300 [Klebsiella pneumoniae subsp. pneumoniae DSM 30104 = JCM 1662 = NBRC 14940]
MTWPAGHVSPHAHYGRQAHQLSDGINGQQCNKQPGERIHKPPPNLQTCVIDHSLVPICYRFLSHRSQR